jgi:hypothetical protein
MWQLAIRTEFFTVDNRAPLLAARNSWGRLTVRGHLRKQVTEFIVFG